MAQNKKNNGNKGKRTNTGRGQTANTIQMDEVSTVENTEVVDGEVTDEVKATSEENVTADASSDGSVLIEGTAEVVIEETTEETPEVVIEETTEETPEAEVKAPEPEVKTMCESEKQKLIARVKADKFAQHLIPYHEVMGDHYTPTQSQQQDSQNVLVAVLTNLFFGDYSEEKAASLKLMVEFGRSIEDRTFSDFRVMRAFPFMYGSNKAAMREATALVHVFCRLIADGRNAKVSFQNLTTMLTTETKAQQMRVLLTKAYKMEIK